jgi:hypothetical protein
MVDGELSKRQHEAVLRLLEQSPEARVLLEELQENAGKLKALPLQAPDADFSREVLDRIKSLPVRVATKAAGAGFPNWIGIAAAAAVLLTVTAISYWFFSPARQPQVVDATPKEDMSPMIARIIEGTSSRFAEPGIRVQVVELAQEKTQTRLANELKKQNAVHLELACKNSAQAVAGLNSVLKNNGVKVLVDAKAQARLKQGTKTEIVVYAENLRAEELAEILGQLGTSETSKSAAERQFASVHVETMTPEHRDRVAKLFGMDSKQLQPPPRGDLGKFIEAPRAVGKQTRGSGSAKPPQPDKFALVLASGTGADDSASADLQRFLQTRRQQPGTMQIVLIVRQESV